MFIRCVTATLVSHAVFGQYSRNPSDGIKRKKKVVLPSEKAQAEDNVKH